MPREGLQHETIENERNFVEMSMQQEVFQKKGAIQRKINEKCIDDMNDKQANLRERFIKVNDFMRDCGEKSVRAEKQIEAELEEQESLKKEIAEIERDLNELSAFEAKFKEITSEFQAYEDVFAQVVAESGTSLEDLMSRCDALSN